jgi:hypothetical protein
VILKEFLANKIERQDRLLEHISHIEALPPTDFLDAIKNIDRYVATEKLDGANLWFGFENDGGTTGTFYTSRAGKGGQTFYSVGDFPQAPAYNGFRAAHAALAQIATKLARLVYPGEVVEIEVMFGQQPNAIVYGDNIIAFLRFVESFDADDGPHRIQQLADTFSHLRVTTETDHSVTQDGLKLEVRPVKHVWRFAAPAVIDSSVVRSVDLSSKVHEVEQFFQAPNEQVPGKTNLEVMTSKLTDYPSDVKELVRAERESLQGEFAATFQKPIKDQLVSSLLRKLKPSLRTAKVDPAQDIGIEGIVFLDPTTNKQFKLVDRDLFTAINKFNFAARSAIQSSNGQANPLASVFKLTQQETTLLDELSSRIGRIFDLSPDMKYYQTSKMLASHGSTPQAVIDSVAALITSPITTREDVIVAISASIKKLKAMLDRFNNNWKSYQTTLPSGRKIKYNEEIYGRTLTSFAEAHEEMKATLDAVKAATNAHELVAAVFSKQLTHLSS